MTTRLTQPPGYAAGSASLSITGTAIANPEAIQVSIVQVDAIERYLDPRNPQSPWVTSVYRFYPLNPRRERLQTVFDLDYGITYHLRPNRPYKLILHEDGRDLEERFTGVALRQPTAPPTGWTPPPDPKGPLSVPAPPAPAPAPIAAEPPAAPYDVVLDRATSLTDNASAADPPVIVEPPAPAPAPVLVPAPAPVPSPAPAPAPSPQPDPLKRRFVLIGAGVLVLLLAVAIGWWFEHRSDEKTPPSPISRDDKKSPDAPLTVEGARQFLGTDPPLAATRDMAKRFMDAHSLDGAFLLLRHAAEMGDPDSALALGQMYDPASWSAATSPLPAPNPAEAARWFKAAAEAGNAEAQYRYGMLLKSGRTEEPNGPELAVQWLQKAAAQGNEQAKAELNK